MLWVRGAAQKSNLLPDTIHLCRGDTARIEVRLDVGEKRVTWRTPAGAVSDTRRIKAFAEGMYYFHASTAGGSVTHADSTYLKLLAKPRPLLRDTFFCAGDKVILDAGNPGMRYQWNTGDKTRRITVASEGVYRVRVNNGKCAVSDTVRVQMRGVRNPLPEDEMSFCLGDAARTLGVKLPAGATAVWHNGTAGANITVSGEGYYAVTITHPQCPEVRDSVKVTLKACACEIMIPNSFTPNEDGRNDLFYPVLACEYSYYNLTITDRWGYEVFVTGNPNARWDGRYKGNLCPEDIYVFKLEAIEKQSGKKSVRKGHISLFR